MELDVVKVLIILLMVLILVFSGIRMRIAGQPYKTGILTIHKLTALAGMVLLIILILKIFRIVDTVGMMKTGLIISGVLLFLTFVTGALLTIERTAVNFLKKIHRVLSYASVVVFLSTIFFL